jgi:hypothetical protein
MTDTAPAGQRLLLQNVFEFAKLSFGPPDGNASVVEYGNTGRIVATIFQAAQPVDDDGHGLPGAKISNNSAHGKIP